MSLDDRLSFGGEGPLGGLPPETEQPVQPQEPKKSNRGFIFIAIAMGGLILLGILALVAAFVFVVPAQRQKAQAAMTQTIVAATVIAESWTPTPQPTPTSKPPTPTTPPKETATLIVPTATATRVVKTTGVAVAATPTPTRATSADWGATTPKAGLGSLGIGAIAVGLSGLVFAVRRMRKS